MTGFKNFLLRGNLIELATAFIMGGAFATLVTAVVNVIMAIIGKVGGQPDFNAWKPGEIPVGALITALVAFLILAAVVYFVIVKPYTVAKEKYFPSEEEGTPEDIALLSEIRDLLATNGGAARTPGAHRDV